MEAEPYVVAHPGNLEVEDARSDLSVARHRSITCHGSHALWSVRRRVWGGLGASGGHCSGVSPSSFRSATIGSTRLARSVGIIEASAPAGGKRHAVVKPPVFAGVSPETVEPARIRSDAPVVINRHFETTASVDRKRCP
jgi:hypothetical protein